MNIHSVIIKCNKYGLIVILDKDLPFEELLKDIEDKFKESAKFFKNAKMAMTIRGRVLSQSEEKQVVETIVNSCGLHILCVIDEDQKEEMLFHQAVDKARRLVLPGNTPGRPGSGDRAQHCDHRRCESRSQCGFQGKHRDPGFPSGDGLCGSYW